ncbi:hypothetical protein BN7_1717 [Wickerhamomyces ciferrii]|uniref:Uncharacterized protein n=1 Tax=Wickerhamomyces ciferrii (strain ATCC 14091 / BCRC 22168 / CBS 111 / JCM 3599 / NBRC 0793 / NRRL Y-1031 F-60-10) TaxID=1206466 RepID=K0KM19_WICCF|nr:uncharacterized protein BN7_1717 [Wickerhamomyces ciferrii]CCH42173.1 hypothetical protein BN7_1717 [Wickerhamomyces ciferrii]
MKGTKLPDEVLLEIVKRVRSVDTYESLYQVPELRWCVINSILIIRDVNVNYSRLDEELSELSEVTRFQINNPFPLGEILQGSNLDKYIVLVGGRCSLKEINLELCLLLSEVYKVAHGLMIETRDYCQLNIDTVAFGNSIPLYLHEVTFRGMVSLNIEGSEINFNEDHHVRKVNTETRNMGAILRSKELHNLNIDSGFAYRVLGAGLDFHNLKTLTFKCTRNSFYLNSFQIPPGLVYLSIDTRPEYLTHIDKSRSENVPVLEFESLDLSKLETFIVNTSLKEKLSFKDCKLPELGERLQDKVQSLINCTFADVKKFKLNTYKDILIENLVLPQAEKISIKSKVQNFQLKDSVKNILVSPNLKSVTFSNASSLCGMKLIEGSRKFVPPNIKLKANLDDKKWSLVHNIRALLSLTRGAEPNVSIKLEEKQGGGYIDRELELMVSDIEIGRQSPKSYRKTGVNGTSKICEVKFQRIKSEPKRERHLEDRPKENLSKLMDKRQRKDHFSRIKNGGKTDKKRFEKEGGNRSSKVDKKAKKNFRDSTSKENDKKDKVILRDISSRENIKNEKVNLKHNSSKENIKKDNKDNKADNKDNKDNKDNRDNKGYKDKKPKANRPHNKTRAEQKVKADDEGPVKVNIKKMSESQDGEQKPTERHKRRDNKDRRNSKESPVVLEVLAPTKVWPNGKTQHREKFRFEDVLSKMPGIKSIAEFNEVYALGVFRLPDILNTDKFFIISAVAFAGGIGMAIETAKKLSEKSIYHSVIINREETLTITVPGVSDILAESFDYSSPIMKQLMSIYWKDTKLWGTKKLLIQLMFASTNDQRGGIEWRSNESNFFDLASLTQFRLIVQSVTIEPCVLNKLHLTKLKFLKLVPVDKTVKFRLVDCYFPKLETLELMKDMGCPIEFIENYYFGKLESFKLHSNRFLSVDGLKLPKAKSISFTGWFNHGRYMIKFRNIQVTKKLEDLTLTEAHHLRAFRKIENNGRTQYTPSKITIKVNLSTQTSWNILKHYKTIRNNNMNPSKVSVFFELIEKKSIKKTQRQLFILQHAYPELKNAVEHAQRLEVIRVKVV